MEISSKDAKKLLNNQDTVFLDVRTTEEREAFSISPSVHIDIFDPLFEDKVLKLDKAKDYVVYCRSGNRSGQAVLFMSSKGFSAKNLEGGTLDW